MPWAALAEVIPGLRYWIGWAVVFFRFFFFILKFRPRSLFFILWFIPLFLCYWFIYVFIRPVGSDNWQKNNWDEHLNTFTLAVHNQCYEFGLLGFYFKLLKALKKMMHVLISLCIIHWFLLTHIPVCVFSQCSPHVLHWISTVTTVNASAVPGCVMETTTVRMTQTNRTVVSKIGRHLHRHWRASMVLVMQIWLAVPCQLIIKVQPTKSP